VDLQRRIRITQPCLRVRYQMEERGAPALSPLLKEMMSHAAPARR
jgi:hypothetical protein